MRRDKITAIGSRGARAWIPSKSVGHYFGELVQNPFWNRISVLYEIEVQQLRIEVHRFRSLGGAHSFRFHLLNQFKLLCLHSYSPI